MIDITVMEESFVSWKERKEWKEWMERAVVGGVDSVDGCEQQCRSGRVSELSALSVQHVDRPKLPPLSLLCSMPQSFGTRLYRDMSAPAGHGTCATAPAQRVAERPLSGVSS